MNTTIDLVFYFEGKDYALVFDFGCKCSFATAKYMFEEGNYSCDCNRSIFMSAEFSDFEEMDCGSEIKLISMSNMKNAVSDDEMDQISGEPRNLDPK